MEKTVKIIQEHPFKERSYTDRNGQPQTFASKGFTLTDGVDTFYAEMTGDTARANKDVHPDPKLIYRVQAQISSREYTDKDGQPRFSNEIRIIRL